MSDTEDDVTDGGSYLSNDGSIPSLLSQGGSTSSSDNDTILDLNQGGNNMSSNNESLQDIMWEDDASLEESVRLLKME